MNKIYKKYLQDIHTYINIQGFVPIPWQSFAVNDDDDSICYKI